jgi:para-aminobenzoate synthetase/4-amino-4-deoxychorismate lyase
LLLARTGDCRVELKPLPAFAQAPIVRLAPLPVSVDDFRLRHKTTLRDFYDAARGDADEVVFVDQTGFVTEGSFTNILVAREGHLLTPPATRGLLPGVLRAELLATGEARECDLRPADLVDGFLLGNSVRGLTPARLELTEEAASQSAVGYA